MSGALMIKDRVNQMRVRQRQAGLMRVEVLVPSDHADAVRAHAAQLREGSQSVRLKEIRKLLVAAYRKYHASCLDNIGIKPEEASFGDAAVVAAALMHRGNSEAYKLGQQISRLAR